MRVYVCARVCAGRRKQGWKNHPSVGPRYCYTRYLITTVHFLGNFFIHFLSLHNISHVCKTAARGTGVGRTRRTVQGVKNFFWKTDARARARVKGWKAWGPATRGLQLLRPFFNGKVVLMNKSLFPYTYTYTYTYIYTYIYNIYTRKRGEWAIVLHAFTSFRRPSLVPPHPPISRLLFLFTLATY